MAEETPVSTLMNFCAANRIPIPDFNLLQDGTASNDPIFIYEVRLIVYETELRVVGRGSSKQRAKHESARSALERLSEMNSPPSQFTSFPVSITKLRQLCHRIGLPTPEYSLVGETGPPHCKQFTIECAVSTLKETATSFSKKAAKHIASERIFNMLQAMDLDEYFGTDRSG